MEFKIFFKGQDYWDSKVDGVILVQKEEDIEPLFKLLCEQDEYWKYYKGLIQVAPKEIEKIEDLEDLCSYVGKTDIYDVATLKEKIPFIIYQYRNQNRNH